jgi:TonB family protein
MKENALLFGTLFDQRSLFTRLKDEFGEAGREFRSSPRAFLAATLSGNALGGARRRMLLRFGLATGIVLYAVVFATILVFWTAGSRLREVSDTHGNLGPPKWIWAGVPKELDGPKDQRESRGGGGGGDHTLTLPSAGLPPDPSFERQLIAPNPEPQLKAPILPVAEIIPVDSRFNIRPDDLAPTGLRDGVNGPPSAGLGSDHGVGTGEKGGIGPGRGRGLGPGDRWNVGGPGTPKIGGAGTSSASDQQRVDQAPVPLNRPRPNYTEEARKNKIQGVILARALIGAEGTVRQVAIRRGLPGGLDGEAILAVSQMRFRPAMRDGNPVATWITLEVEFNLR